MKVYVFLTLVIYTAYAAPVINSNLNNGYDNASPEVKVRRFKAALYLFAPETWINSFNAISDAGQKCFLEAANSEGASEIYHNDDIDRMKNDLKSKCPAYANEYNNFIDISSQTVKSLPANFLQGMKDWEDQMQALTKKFQDASKSPQSATAFKQFISEFAKSTATFTKRLTTLTEAERRQISTAFPKLQPFFSGDHAVEFLTRINTLYESLANGNLDISTMQKIGQQLKDTLQILWQQYSTVNAEGLKKASEFLGNDLMYIGNLLKTEVDGQFGNRNSGFQLNAPDQSRPDSSNTNGQKGKDNPNIPSQNGQQKFQLN